MSNFAKKATANKTKAGNVVAQMVKGNMGLKEEPSSDNEVIDTYKENVPAEPEKIIEFNVSEDNTKDKEHTGPASPAINTETQKPKKTIENKNFSTPKNSSKKPSKSAVSEAGEKTVITSNSEAEVLIKYLQISLENKSERKQLLIYPSLKEELEKIVDDISLKTGKRQTLNDLINQVLLDFAKNEALKKCN